MAEARRAGPLRLTPVPSVKRRSLGSREGTVTTSLAIPRRLHQEAIVTAVKFNRSFAERLCEGINEWLTRHRR